MENVNCSKMCKNDFFDKRQNTGLFILETAQDNAKKSKFFSEMPLSMDFFLTKSTYQLLLSSNIRKYSEIFNSRQIQFFRFYAAHKLPTYCSTVSTAPSNGI